MAFRLPARGKAGGVSPHPSKGKGGPILGTAARRPTGRVFQQILPGWAPCPRAPPANAHLCGPSVKCPVMCSSDIALRPGAIYRSILRKAIILLILPAQCDPTQWRVVFHIAASRCSSTNRELRKGQVAGCAKERRRGGNAGGKKAAVSDPEVSLPGPSLTKQQNRLQNCRRDAYLPNMKSQSMAATRQIFC